METTDFEYEFEVHEAKPGERLFDTFLKKASVLKKKIVQKIKLSVMINNSLKKNKAE